MRFRFIRILTLLAVLAGTFAGMARSLDFEDDDPHPPRGEVGMVYSYDINTKAGCLPHRLEILSGQLPPGTSLRRVDYDTHVLEGVMTEAGTFSVWLAVRDCDNRSAETLFTFEVWARRFSIATSSLSPAGVGAPYSVRLQTAGIDSNTTWEVTSGSLPAGLTLSTDGVISGTPTAAGASTFTVEATGTAKDFSGTRADTKELRLNVVALAARLSKRSAEVGVPFRASLLASGGQGPYTWTANGAPAGLSVASDGSVTGTPTRAGTYTINAHIVDATGAASSPQVKLVVSPRLAIVGSRLPSGSSGHPYRARVTLRGGLGPFHWRASGLPSGLRIGPRSGSLAGTPTTAGTFHVTVRARDELGGTAKKTLLLTIS